MTLAPGTTIDGKYRVVRTVGRGGMGVVYVAEHTFLRKPVALKLLQADLCVRHPEIVPRFVKEAQATSLIEHENVVRVTDFGRSPGGELYLVMELLCGRPLSEELAETPRLAPERALRITAEILGGLEAAHAQGVLHRDLKPENVFLVARPDGSEIVKLVDFGIAKLCDEPEGTSRLTMTGSVLGTPRYMAPEQARGARDLDFRVDVHAVGVLLYEMLAGRAPYEGENYNLVLFQLLSGSATPLGELRPDLDPRLCEVVRTAMAPERAQRFDSARAFRQALEAVAQAPERPAAAPPAPAPRAAPISLATPVPTRPARRAGASVPAASSAPAAPVADPFAPPPEAAELALEVVAPPKARGRTAPPAGEAAPAPLYAELTAFRREATAPQRVLRRILYGLLAIAALSTAIWYWQAPAADSGEARPVPRAHIALQGAPEGAFVFVDGVRTFLNPIEMSISPAPHELRIECLGYRPLVRSFVPSRDQAVDAHLERLPGASLHRP